MPSDSTPPADRQPLGPTNSTLSCETDFLIKKLMGALPDKLQPQLLIALSNLRLATLSAEFLLESKRLGNPEMPTEVFLKGPKRRVRLPSPNCGFFVTPIVHCAILDVRRTLEFFRLRWDKTKQEFTNFSDSKYPDDLYITDLGLSAVDPPSLLALSLRIIGRSASLCLTEVCFYANKDMAHFSKTNRLPELQSIVDSTKVIHESILVFVYDALALPRPKIQPTIHEG